MPDPQPFQRGMSNLSFPAASQSSPTTRPSGTSHLASSSALSNVGSWVYQDQSKNPSFDAEADTRLENRRSRQADYVSPIYSRAGQNFVRDVHAHNVPLVLGPNHSPRDVSWNVTSASNATPVALDWTLGRDTFPMHRTAMAVRTTGRYTFVVENTEKMLAQPAKRRRSEAQGQAARSTIMAGGACIWCSAKKKGCSDTNPCEPCTKNGYPCVRGNSSFCLASTIKNNVGRQQLDPSNFQEAQATMTELKQSALSQDTSYTSVFVDWALYSNHRTWHVETTKLDLDPLDAAVQASAVEVALGFVTVPQLEGLFPDTLGEKLNKTIILVAAIDQLFRSKVSVEPMALPAARMTVFFLMSIYAIEMCDASLSFATELYTALKNKRLAEPSVQYAIRLYQKVISKLLIFQRSGSLMSSIFRPIESRLKNISHTLQQLLSCPISQQRSSANDVVVPHIPHLPSFDIAIGFSPARAGTLPTAGWRQEMRRDQLHYCVYTLLRNDFDVGMNHPRPVFDTINPQQLLSPEMATQTIVSDCESSSPLYSATLNHIFSSAVGGSDTNITYPHSDVSLFYSPPFEGAADYTPNSIYSIGGPFGRDADFSSIGGHFPN